MKKEKTVKQILEEARKHPAYEEQSACDNCTWQGDPTIELEEIPDLAMRLDPGEEVPSGECPKCGALCYLIKPEKKKEGQ